MLRNLNRMVFTVSNLRIGDFQLACFESKNALDMMLELGHICKIKSPNGIRRSSKPIR